MLTVEKDKSFDKDIKTLQKKYYNFDNLKKVINLLTEEKILPNKYKNHYLKGNLQNYQECHIDNNIILIYQITEKELFLSKIGTHKDLLNK